jgi:hypothetical protein
LRATYRSIHGTWRRLLVDLRLEVQDLQYRQAVPLADQPVVEVVRRRDLHHARAEFAVDVVVADDRDVAIGERQSHRLADQVPVALVLRMHGDGRVAEHRLGSRRRDDQRAGVIGERIAQLPQLALLLLAVHLEVGHRGAELGIPVDQPLAAIDSPSS